MKKIGLIGGIGPYGTMRYYNELMYAYKSIKEEFPSLLIDSIPMSKEIEEDFISDGNDVSRSRVIQMIKNSCEIFSRLEVEAVAIACNTLSPIFLEVSREFNFKKNFTPVGSVLKRMKIDQKHHPLILASNFTIQQNLYANENTHPVKLNISEQNFVNEKIHIFLGNQEKQNIPFPLDIQNLSKHEYDSIIIGCTDLPLNIISNFDVPCYDSISCLIQDSLEYLLKGD